MNNLKKKKSNRFCFNCICGDLTIKTIICTRVTCENDYKLSTRQNIIKTKNSITLIPKLQLGFPNFKKSLANLQKF